MSLPELPIYAVLPELLAALRLQPSAVLIAPPGAGKTTAVAPALRDQPWCSGTVILLSPRRVAARAAAERMAEVLGEPVGRTIGYLTRLDSKRSPTTRVLVMTEAIFVATIVGDPELAGVSAVLFDEAHERHLDSDLGLALAVETQAVLRPDLRLVVMSATIDGARFAALLDNAPVIESAGKAYPLAIRWLGARPEARIEDAMTSALLTAWRGEQGDILAFLPGMREIERTAERLADRLPGALVLPLHGQCEPAAQRAAIRRDPQGRRRIVLATAIAETSLTLDGVSVVVDAGLSRRAEFDKTAGVTALVTHRASQAAAAQRAGRAARQGPGVAYRLWEEAAHPGRAAFDPPEMLTSDLTPLMLALAQWGAGDPARMAWIDPPPAAAMGAAISKLRSLGAVVLRQAQDDRSWQINPHGRSMAALPMEPSLAHMLLYAAQHGVAAEAAQLALLLQERGLGGRGDDLAQRLARWKVDRSSRADASRKLAAGWASKARGLRQAQAERGFSEPNKTTSAHAELVEPKAAAGQPHALPPLGILLAEAYPDNIAKRRDPSGEDWLSSGGRGYRLDPGSPLVTQDWLVIGDAQGSAKGARITAALPLDEADLTRWLPHRITECSLVRWLPEQERAEPVRERRIGAILLSRGYDAAAGKDAVAARLVEHFRAKGRDSLPLSAASQAFLVRAGHAGIAQLSDEALAQDADEWLGNAINGASSLRDIPPQHLHDALANRLDYAARQQLERLAPAQFTSPAGSSHAIDYADPGGPSVEVRVQALFGLDRHPGYGQPEQPLLLKLTSPGGKPVQTTRDLPGFWRGSWRDVQREMKGRYPRHRWPDEPWTELPSLKTKNAFHRT